jgi:hypothetical protein
MKRKVKKYNVKHDEKLKEREEKEKIKREEEKNEIKPFSFKSAFAVIISCLTGSVIVPYLLGFVGIKDVRIGILLGSMFVSSFGFVWVRNFMDSKKGFSKSFWIQYAVMGAVFGAIAYLWFFGIKLL